jgi:predicted transcriptional regulator
MNNTITLPPSLFKRLEYEEWKLEQIDAGLADLNAGRVLSDEDFWKRINKPKKER